MERILIASKFSQIQKIAQQLEGFVVVGFTNNKENITPMLEQYEPNTLFVVDGLSGDGDVIDIMIQAKLTYHDLKIIFATGEVDKSNMLALDPLAKLTDYGIYDIYTSTRYNAKMIETMLRNKKTIQDVKDIRRFKNDEGNKSVLVLRPKADGYNNIVAVSSIKPGTGKSFTSTNMAMAIAKYGKPKIDGSMPKVAIVEGDLQSLSVGTLLQLHNERYNLKAALAKVATIIDENGRFTVDEYRQREVKDFILRCFISHPEVPNLYALTGSQLSIREIDFVNPYQYFVMIKMVVDEFDLIIIDSNSSLEHRTTGPILQLAKTCFFVMDLDFCNVRSNLRYRQILEELGLTHKIRYVLNKDITPQLADSFTEPLKYGARSLEADGFNLVAKFPMIDAAVISNRLYEGKPIILDKTRDTLFARMEISKLADSIWPMNNQFELNNELKGYAKKKRGFFSKIFGRK